ncbi:MAG: hypothetical protein HUJ63_02285, partial [Enterococcus sp.]|nr:hypothetical protein [Enterococcus sp.]
KKESFDSIEKWITNLKESADQKIRIILVGNKCDLEEKRVITKEEGQQKAKDLGIDFVETSISDETCFIRITKDVEQTDVFQKMKEVLSRHAGHIPVIVYFEKTGKKIVLNEENWVAHTSASQQQLAYVLGEQNVIFK